MGVSITVDPIVYAWKACNSGVPLPRTLARSAGVSVLAQSLSNAPPPILAEMVAKVDAAQAALHSFILSTLPVASETDPNDLIPEADP